ncbi:MAG: thiamine pyrophosphate-binding protein, partial [Opitutales bacterium]|nr:thiamine pyrophosphate-binding protein [Opitutales bacterium]
MQSYSGADIIITLLERQGIKTIAGIPGGANLPIYDALARNGRIRHVLARHEQGAGFIAQGMTRVSGEVQVCFATSGPGATNILTAIADARLDSIPIVCITGQVPSSLIGTDAFQEVDTYGLSIPITKHNFLVRNVSELLSVIPEAFRIAASGRPGPVLIDVPKDVQQACIEIETWPEPGRPDPIPGADRAALIEAASMINAAQRPVFYIGGGVVASGASKALLALCEKGSIPVTPTLMGLDAIPADHPLNIGMLGMHAARYTNQALHACDLLVAVGSRFDDRATGRVESFCPTARIIHVDIDPSEIDKIKPSSIGITGDARQVLEAWLPEIRETDRSEWTGEIERLKQAFPMEFPGADDPMTAYGVIRKTAALLP